MQSTPTPGLFTREIPCDWDLAAKLWNECASFLAGHGLGKDEVYALTMAASELLENAVKYGDWERAPKDLIALSIEVAPRNVIVEVQCPTADDVRALRKLDEQVQWIRGFQSPFEAYVERLKLVSARGHDLGESGLGLIRIAYEGRCVVDFYVTSENRLAMSAVYRPQGMYG
ncbi:MAG: ATP-binding protein [Archangiaceae bacterium]|nr:ATP-binding protein [Archangiaceae bacterium]